MSLTRILLSIFVVISIAGCTTSKKPSSTSPTSIEAFAARSEGTVRVGAWNIENLGTRRADSQTNPPEPDQTPEALADYIASSGVDVLALEEIHDDDQPSSGTPGHEPWRNKILERALARLNQQGG